jgi:hypothetical protein
MIISGEETVARLTTWRTILLIELPVGPPHLPRPLLLLLLLLLLSTANHSHITLVIKIIIVAIAIINHYE